MLDADQERIVNLNEGYFSVLAGAGSGKSTVLLHRTGRLAREFGSDRILTVTFTSEAAKNLRTRCGKIFPEVNPSTFRTLHSVALEFANNYHEVFPFPLADNPLADESIAAKAVFEATANKISYKAFTSWVSLQKRKKIDPQTSIYTAERSGVKLDYALAYKRYQSILKKAGILDFDDLIFFMVSILECRPDIRQECQKSFVLLDEAQDCCELDWRLLQLLSYTNKNLMAVGDCGQSLYNFRGGSPENFLNMDKYFSGCETFYLPNNYRSSPEIVAFGKKAYPYPEVAEKFVAVKTEQGVEPTVSGFSVDYREAQSVIEKIKNYDPDSCAILARTNQALRVFEDFLIEENIKYYLLGNSGFWESPEVQHVLYYVRCIYMLTDNSVLGALRAPFWPSRFIKKKAAADQIKNLIETKNITAWKALDHVPGTRDFKTFLLQQTHFKHLPAGEAVAGIIKNLKLVEFYKDEENISPDRNPLDNLKELCRAASRKASLEEFLEWVRKVQNFQSSRRGVCLSTIHSSKGKEFEKVFLVQCNQELIPHNKSENIDEEKCVFFVAVSRAKSRLFISFNGTPSPFLSPFLEPVNEP